jgi:hypothetical protein
VHREETLKFVTRLCLERPASRAASVCSPVSLIMGSETHDRQRDKFFGFPLPGMIQVTGQLSNLFVHSHLGNTINAGTVLLYDFSNLIDRFTLFIFCFQVMEMTGG